ncbi:adenylyl-sulfate kinase [Dendronalium sp. ChiSLP03b]|nr:adenylyl-sulfate kinase [Dendronalium sp. ChiSLP03b]MDZ8208956.1 adenylyl-sulfate kinase [Dendronalium sp. ChiSLP03b]
MSVVAKSSRKYATPIACAVAQELKRRNYPTELLDGDVVRNHLSQGLGFSIS